MLGAEVIVADLIVHRRPELRSPLLIAAFAGWNDAGESATSAVRFMRRRWREEPFAEIDPEEFYDFTQTRPRVRLEKGENVITVKVRAGSKGFGFWANLSEGEGGDDQIDEESQVRFYRDECRLRDPYEYHFW